MFWWGGLCKTFILFIKQAIGEILYKKPFQIPCFNTGLRWPNITCVASDGTIASTSQFTTWQIICISIKRSNGRILPQLLPTGFLCFVIQPSGKCSFLCSTRTDSVHMIRRSLCWMCIVSYWAMLGKKVDKTLSNNIKVLSELRYEDRASTLRTCI